MSNQTTPATETPTTQHTPTHYAEFASVQLTRLQELERIEREYKALKKLLEQREAQLCLVGAMIQAEDWKGLREWWEAV